ncbi:hypothetical protein H7X65_01405 [Candidatus Parcubacteria bacterium]|nr:hypothetical protein [Candidatus Parcubacteria bacterium]
MDTKKQRVLLVPGNWIGKKLLTKLQTENPGLEVVLLIGLTLKQRVKKVKSLIMSNHYDAIIGYSSGCTVLAELERLNMIMWETKVLYCAPAPQPSVRFKISERMFGKVGKYLPQLLLKPLGRLLLSKYDFLSIFEGKKDVEVVENLEPESCWFMFGQIFGQLCSPKPLADNPNRIIFRSVGDQLLGSTQNDTVKILRGAREIFAITPGHYGVMLDLKYLLGLIK